MPVLFENICKLKTLPALDPHTDMQISLPISFDIKNQQVPFSLLYVLLYCYYNLLFIPPPTTIVSPVM